MERYYERLKTNAKVGQASMSRDGGIFASEVKRCRQQFASFVIQEGSGDSKYSSTVIYSIASESAFSTSGRVLSIRRTRLTPTYLEMCICLKDHLDAAERIQHITSIEDGLEYEGNYTMSSLAADLQDKNAINKHPFAAISVNSG
ncbi:zinc finger BED domain-containing protein RICESLEEPER 2 [Tanacetum coccineum]